MRDAADRIGCRVRNSKLFDMIKKLIQYFKRRNDMRLRKWCAELATHTGDIGSDDMYYTANKIYEWVKGLPESKT